MKYKYIVFDFDGTLVDSVDAVSDVLNALVAKYHFEHVSPEEFKHRNGLSAAKKIQLLAFMLKIEKEFKAMYSEHTDKLKPIDGMLETLAWLAGKGYKLAIISSNAEANIRKFLELRDIKLDIIVRSSKGLFGKHKTIGEFIRQQQCKNTDILYVGDEIRDIKACNKSGVDIAFVNWGLDADEDKGGLDITFTAKSPNDLRDFLA